MTKSYKIIGLCGRLQSGKSTIANICEEFGYKRLYFALPLKQLCANLLQVDIDTLNELKINGTEINLKLTDEICNIIASETQIPIDIVRKLSDNREIKNVRDLLQFVGTDIIRQHNNNWHVDKIRGMLNPQKKYIIDDVRFPNEKEMIEELGGTLWFVVRPNLSNVSNHISETSIKWQDVNNIIVNDKSLTYLETYWRMFMENGYEQSLVKRQSMIDKILGNLDKIENLQDDKDFAFSLLDALFISIWEFKYEPIPFDKTTIPSVEIVCDSNRMHFLNIHMSNGNGVNSIRSIKNPLNIEDYKFVMFDN